MVNCRAFVMLSVLHFHPFFPPIEGRSLVSQRPRFLLRPTHRAPLSIVGFCAKASGATAKDVDPAKIAANLVALLGSEEDARSVDPDLAQELLSCLRFLVPRVESRRGFEFRNGEISDGNVETRRSFSSRKWLAVAQDERVKKLIWWPPAPVMELARSAVEWGGDHSVIERALNSTHYPVPDVEQCIEHKCQLTRTTFGRRFVNEELNLYMAFLFETISSLASSAGFNVSLNRYDLFHGHLFLATNTGRLGILFHAKEYPAYNKETFPFHLGYCQTGSFVAYDNSMNLRNILWLAPMPDCSNRKCSSQWLAPGALVVLDAHPGGIIYEDLVGQWVQDVRTIYEDDFGDVIFDVNYLNVANGASESKIFIC